MTGDKRSLLATALSLVALFSVFAPLPLVRADGACRVDYHRMPPDLPGDVNCDGVVDLKDVSRVGRAFGSIPGDAKWDFQSDVDENRKVDLKDWIFVCKKYGKEVEIPSEPAIYWTSFELEFPNNYCYTDIYYYVLLRVYVPPMSSGMVFYLHSAPSMGWVWNIKLDNVVKAPIAGGEIFLELGSLSGGYHLLELEWNPIDVHPLLSFHVETAGGERAWLTRFRFYVPDHDADKVEYTVRMPVNFTRYDLYYLMGFADDYLCNFKVDSLQWHEWQWNMSREAIYAWQDGFLYPVFNSKERGLFSIEFSFGEIWGPGLLDYQFVSWELQKHRIGRPKFHMTTTLTAKEFRGAKPVLKNYWLYGGSSWCDLAGSETGDPTSFGFVTQNIRVIANGTIVDPGYREMWSGLEYPQEVGLGISVGFLKLDPRENDNIDIGIMFNLTSGNLYRSYWEGNETADIDWADHDTCFEPTSIEIWTPSSVASINIPALVFNETQGVSFISPQFKVISSFAGSLTTGLLMFASSEALPEEMISGPYGAVVVTAAAAAGFGMKQLFDYLGGQTVVKSYEDPGNFTYRRLRPDGFMAPGDEWHGVLPNNVTQALFIRLKAAERYHCGSVKIRIKGVLTPSWWHWWGSLMAQTGLPIEVETTFVLPLFVRD